MQESWKKSQLWTDILYFRIQSPKWWEECQLLPFKESICIPSTACMKTDSSSISCFGQEQLHQSLWQLIFQASYDFISALQKPKAAVMSQLHSASLSQGQLWVQDPFSAAGEIFGFCSPRISATKATGQPLLPGADNRSYLSSYSYSLSPS